MHTKDYLAAELRKSGLNDMADKAAEGYYHDYLSPLDSPAQELGKDLLDAGTEEAKALLQRHILGEFDASEKESDDWMQTKEGQDSVRQLIGIAAKE